MRAYPWERQEMFLDGHIRAFDWYGGVFPTLVFDNLKTAVKRILKGKARVEQARFTAFRAHYTFEARFCNPARGQEKRRCRGPGRLCTPELPGAGSRGDRLRGSERATAGRCAADDQRRIGGRSDDRTIGERHAVEQERLLALPDTRFENTKVVGVRISPYQTAQVDQNRYSVPTAYVGRRLWAHIGCDRVSFYADQKKVAEHDRAFGHSDWRIDPLHYLELIRRKVASFESARPIRQWRDQWPTQYETALERLRIGMGTAGAPGSSSASCNSTRTGIWNGCPRPSRKRSMPTVSSWKRCGTFLMREDTPTRSHAPLESGLMPGITDLTIAGADLDQYDRLLAGGAR